MGFEGAVARRKKGGREKGTYVSSTRVQNKGRKEHYHLEISRTRERKRGWPLKGIYLITGFE